jgi:pimeloyl-ACP methyl ester carboxylesterase
VATFALIHGGGGSAWDWHLVVPELRERGQQPVAVDVPSDDESAGWWDYADAVVDAVGYRSDLVVVGHSLGGFTAPLVCAPRPHRPRGAARGDDPAPGELFSDWWTNTGHRDLLNQAVHRRHAGRGWNSLQAAMEYTTSSIWWVRNKTRVISQMATAVVMDSRGFREGDGRPVALVAVVQGWFPVRR